jgi:hypothetical protein
MMRVVRVARIMQLLYIDNFLDYLKCTFPLVSFLSLC